PKASNAARACAVAQSATRRYVVAAAAALFVLAATASAQTRWTIQDDGSIAWSVKRGEAHQDNVEMSGEQVSVIVSYGVESNATFTVKRQVVFPMLRFKPNGTRDHLALDYSED